MMWNFVKGRFYEAEFCEGPQNGPNFRLDRPLRSEVPKLWYAYPWWYANSKSLHLTKKMPKFNSERTVLSHLIPDLISFPEDLTATQSDTDEDHFNVTQALGQIPLAQKEEGSFDSVIDTYLPTLDYKSLADINSSLCPNMSIEG
ncbi:hypothetical protein AVEN_123602-1 [Araneus ventricosus]|uniref:Uncharacterized protein n=1 Tax=Araneus ventricosus TaxID=182803 RepID=A0A4Y2THN7_ARAVE|nr:hypothetical protein AVEN_123602-1 [Araneus ventricosus]